MIRVTCNGKVMALAFSHPSYEAPHIQDTIIIEDGKVTAGKLEVTRESRKTVATIFDVTVDGFKERAKAEAKVHFSDQFRRSQGRLIALKKLTSKAIFTKGERKAIWDAYIDRANAEHISPPKTPASSVIPFPAGTPHGMSMIGNTHQVSNYIL